LTRSTISGSPGEEREIVRGGGRKSEAVSERDLRSRLQAGDLQHPGCPWEVCCEHGTKVFHHLLGDHLALVARDSVIDLHEVDPAHHRSPCEQPLNSGECGLLTIQPGKDGPRVEADVHRGSRARSSSRRAAIPVFANRPPSFTADRRATSTTAHARTFALAAVTIVVFFAGAEAIRVPVYQQARSLFTGSHVASFRVTNAGRSFLLSEPQQAHDAQAIVTSVERIARPGESLFVGPQDLRTAGSSDVFLYFLLPALKPASYYMQVDPHTINEPSNRFVRELPRAQFLILKKTPPAPPSELGAPEANEIVAAHFCVDTTTPTYSLYSRCR
jgi:hypothetical protein